MNLENFGVNTTELKNQSPKRHFRAWIEEWEEDLLKKNDIIAEVRLLEKYKDLVFYDPDNDCIYTVWDKNLEWQRGRNGGWCLIGCPMNNKLEDEPFTIGPMVIDMIADTDQNENVNIILNGKVASV